MVIICHCWYEIISTCAQILEQQQNMFETAK